MWLRACGKRLIWNSYEVHTTDVRCTQKGEPEMANILFLEDEKMIREVLAEYMTVTGYSVTECESGDDAVELIDDEENNFDLAVLDIRVPGKTGLEVLRHIKTKYGDTVGTIMLTAYEDVNTQLEAFNHMADDYITKPASPIILLKRIEAVLRRTGKIKELEETGSPEAAKTEDPECNGRSTEEDKLVIDEEGYRAFYGERNLRLTVSEFSLLKVLKDSPGRVFGRDILINKIFDEEYIANDRIIDAHIKNLRKKLPKDYIETVIGIGYRWREEWRK